VRVLLLRSEPERARAATLLREVGQRSDPGATAQNILREALADPSALLLVELPNATWVDVEGNQVSRDRPATTAEDHRIVLVHSAAVVNARGALDEVAPLLGQAVLEATIRDQSGRLAAEHDRAEVAAATERRRLERDLHDGVQGRLLALALDLRMAQRDLSDASAQLVLSDATTALTSAIGELRALAAGSTPELLSREGLRAALTDLTRRMPLPVALTTSAGRLPAQVEIVAYLVVCEAITNTMKHADATMVSVEVRVESEVAVVVVSDDGRGGADLRAGTGLRGLSERVSSAGGTLVVSDRRPTGTTLEVTIPCGS
jgi:signal transduction histidine kinase